MRILVLCDMFPPAFGPRMGYLCKYMKRAGWEPVVVTEQIEDDTFSFLKDITKVTYVSFFHARNRILRKIEWIIVSILDYLFQYKNRKICRAASHILDGNGFDGILCSTYRTFPLPAALRLAQKYRLPLVVDLRDIIEQYASNEFISHTFRTIPLLDEKIIAVFRNRLLRDRNRVLVNADRITTVSPWHVEQISRYNACTELIYNGYDPELFYPQDLHTDQFSITYTGRLISLAARDPSLLFEAVSTLNRKGLIDPGLFRVKWYIDPKSEEIIKRIVSPYSIGQYMDFYNYVPASRIPDILNSSSILLQLANKFTPDGPKGIMTTKLFEAMAVEKPLLCVRSDESYMESVIRSTRSGLAARTTDEVCGFILQQYRIWKEKGYTHIDVDREAVSSFSRKKQAEQFMDIFTGLRRK